METDERLEAAHEEIEVKLPRWVLCTLAESAEVVANAEECPDYLRRDCDSAAKIARARMDDGGKDDAE